LTSYDFALERSLGRRSTPSDWLGSRKNRQLALGYFMGKAEY